MRALLFIWMALTLGSVSAQSTAEFTSAVDHLYDAYVENGLVDYQSIVVNKPAIDALAQSVDQVSQGQFQSSDEEKAFLINAYNIFVIKQVVDHYPIGSPQEIANFFTDKKFLFSGKKVSLNELEKDVLLKKYPDARLHFALVCAAQGCPKLRSEAYNAENLESMLDAQSKSTLNDSYFLQYSAADNTLNISKIFDWYKADFGGNDAERIAFINQYLDQDISADAKFKFKEYDWTLNGKDVKAGSEAQEKSNLQLFTPSALFTKGEFEVSVFNSIYSQQSVRDEDGDLIDLGQTQNFFTSMIQITTGVSKKARFNVGVDVFINKARIVEGEASAFDVFSTSDDAIFNKTLLSYVGPRIKWVPFKGVPRLSVQSALWIPVSDELESEGFVAHDRYSWFTQLFFDKNLGDDFQIFLEADLLYRFARQEEQNDFFRTPLSAFLSYFPSPKSTLYVFSQYSPKFETTVVDGNEDFGLNGWFTQFGIGGKYQITKALGIEASYSNFALSSLEGAGYTVNFGLRYIYR